MNFPICIGSRKRVPFPMSKLVSGANVFVEPQEFEEYRKEHGSLQKIVKLEKNNGGFAYMCNQQLAWAKKNKHPYYMFCDDDVFGFSGRASKMVDLNIFFKEGVSIMKQKGLSQLMMSFQGHNWFYKGELKSRIGAWCVVINCTQDLLNVGGYDESLTIFNDWDVSAKLLLTGRKTACWYEYMFAHKMKSLPGGAADIYKKREVTLKAAKYMQQRYGEKVVRIVEAHGQLEPRFRWGVLGKN